MKDRGVLRRFVISACAMLVIILDSKTAVRSAQDGIELCIRTVIPSLFPFFVLSGIISSALIGQRLSALKPLGRFCRIPTGAESLVLLGFLSGYPVGAALIRQANQEGKLSHKTARRMLGFCNNAGPAFIFGMLTPMFESTNTVWFLWIVHIISALLTGFILPVGEIGQCTIHGKSTVTFTQSMQNAIRTMASVCGWVLLFRIILGFCSRWFLWVFPLELQILFAGSLELTNGCVLLRQLPQEGMRFILASVMLSFGGLCVSLQTVSVTGSLGTGYYFPGKVAQTLLSVSLSVALQTILFDNTNRIPLHLVNIVILGTAVLTICYLLCRKKVVAFGRKMLYNTGNNQSRGSSYAISQENHALL